MMSADEKALRAVISLAIALSFWPACTPANFAAAFSSGNVTLPPDNRYISISLAGATRTNPVAAQLEPLGRIPTQFAVLIGARNFSNAKWGHFTNSVSLDLGPREGLHRVSFGYKWGPNETEWETFEVRLVTTPPTVVITNPTYMVTSQPLIQLQGYSTEPLSLLKYDVIDGNGRVVIRDEQGFVNDQYYDSGLARFTTNIFTCYDIALNPGTNTIMLRCVDLAGNVFRTNLPVVFTTAGDSNPPSLTLIYPQDRAVISGPEFALRLTTGDPTAKILALISESGGRTWELEGLIGRNGEVWVEGIALTNSPIFISVVAFDVANNSSFTNITVRKSPDKLVMDPVPRSQLWNSTVTVTGSFTGTNHTIRVNGVNATVDAAGHWTAEKVPVTEGGTAVFDVTAIPNDGTEVEDAAQTNDVPVIVWGNETKSLKAGIIILSADTNRFNPYTCQLLLTSCCPTNSARVWMRPKEQYRYVLRLFDESGKEVQNVAARSMGAPLPVGLNIRHLRRQDAAFVDGAIPFFSGRPVCLATVSLVDQFALRFPGNYRLEVIEHLFEIGADGQLIPVSLPPVSAQVSVIDQPTARVFYLSDLHRAKRLWWGPPMHSLQTGITYEHRLRPKMADVVQVFLINQSTNDLRDVVLPRPEEQFEMALLDSTGREVPRTALGKRQGQPLSTQVYNSRRPLSHLFLDRRDAIGCMSFDLHDYFEIRKPGKYHLTYVQRLYRMGKNGRPEPITLPMVVMPLEIFITPFEE